MDGKQWPSIEESVRLAQTGIIDDSKVACWPDAANVEALRVDLEQHRAKRQGSRPNREVEKAGKRAPGHSTPTRRGSTKRATS